MFSSLRSRILTGFLAIAAVNLAFGLWAILQFSDVGDITIDLVSATYQLNTSATRLVGLIDHEVDLLRRMYSRKDRRDLIDTLESNARVFDGVLTELKNGPLIRGRDSNVARIHNLFRRFDSSASAYRLMLSGLIDGDPRAQFRDSIEPTAGQLKQELTYLLLKSPIELEELRADVDRNIRRALIFVMVAVIVGALIGLVGGGLYSRWIVRPIRQLMEAARAVAHGHLDTRIHIASNDELGDLSFEFNRMVERLRSYEEMNIEQLLLEKRKTEAIVQSIGTSIVVVDAEMTILLINPAARELLGIDNEADVVGGSLREYESSREIIPVLASAMAVDGSSFHDAEPYLYLRQEEGRDRYYSVAALPLSTASSVQGAVAVFSDITHVKELERLKSEFLAKVSHEFRTPLTSIMMSVDILREGLVGDINAEQLDLLNSSKDDCRRLSKLIGDILELSRVDSRRIERVVSQMHLADVVRETMKPHELQAREKGVNLTANVASDVPAIWGDPEEIRWVISNLISNAIRHTPSGGAVRLSIIRNDDVIQMEVADTGEGIPLEGINLIFERFHQGGSRSVATPGSVGLGLAIVKEVVEGYGGRVSVASEPGRGSTFTVRIPIRGLRNPSESDT